MSLKNILYFVLALLFFTACKAPIEPDFKEIKDLKVSLSGFTSARITGEALFFNPNNTSLDIKNAEIDVSVDGQKVTRISKEINIKALPEEDFTIPIDLKLSLSDLHVNSLSSALDMLGGNEKQIHFTGKIKVKVYGINFNVPIDHKENVRLKL